MKKKILMLLAYSQLGSLSLKFIGCTMVLLLSLAFTRQSFGLGDKGHEGIYRRAFEILKATPETKQFCATTWPEWRDKTACFPDNAVVYDRPDPILITIPIGPIPQFNIPKRTFRYELDLFSFIDSLNSAEHYFDPYDPLIVAGSWLIEITEDDQEQIAKLLTQSAVLAFFNSINVRVQPATTMYEMVYNFVYPVIFENLPEISPVFSGTARTFEEYLSEQRGSQPCPGADGAGHNAITAILFCLNGRGSNDSSNPSGLMPSEGFVTLAKQTNDPCDPNFKKALICLGAAAHYIVDMHSAGHTEWHSWPNPAHWAFDDEGDNFLADLGSIDDLTPKLLLSFSGHPAPCYVISGKNLGTEIIPYPIGFWEMDLPRELFRVAETSRQIWERYWQNPPPNEAFNQHLLNAIATTAGIIDWSFSSAAKPDGPYARDATNFFGMAKALFEANAESALPAPEHLAGKECHLGGVDQDDYFPIQRNHFQRICINIVEGWELIDKIKAEAFINPNDPRSKPISGIVNQSQKYIEIDLGTSPATQLLLRIYSPDGYSFRYTVTFLDEVTRGMLDCVLCIDKSGSMVDDIEAVQEVLDEVLQELNVFASENNISLQLGLVTYTRHDDVNNFGAQWLQAQPLTSDVGRIKQSIADIRILGAQAGAGGWEDMYAALLCGMGARDLFEDEQRRETYGQPDGSGNLLDLGWRPGACKICLPIGDEPPSDPDWKGRTLATVVTRADELDPVHVYPIVVQGPIESWLLGTKTAMTKLARRTGGQVTHVSKAEELPSALVKTVKLAVRRHRNEVWRKEHPPYALYIMALVIGLVVIFAFVGVFIAQFRKQPEQAMRRS